MGMGHLYRCQKIIEVLERNKFSVTLLTRDFEESKKVYEQIGFDDLILLDKDPNLEQESAILRKRFKQGHFQLCLNDQLNSTYDEMSLLRLYCNKIITFDDRGPGCHVADNVINVLYPNVPSLSNEINDFSFLILKDCTRQKSNYIFKPAVKSILINQGAADTWGAIPDIILDLNNTEKSYHLIILLGPAFQHFHALDEVLKRSLKHTMEVVKETKNITDLFSRSDLAILGVGNTLFEALSLGIPVITSTREEKELITAKILLGKDLVEGNIELYKNNTLHPLVDKLTADTEKRRLRFTKTREAFGYSGLYNILAIIEKHLAL